MKLPRDLSGSTLAAVLCREWNYVEVHQSGSHIIVQTEDPTHQRMAIPAHKSLRIGTLNAILRAVATHKGVSRDTLVESL